MTEDPYKSMQEFRELMENSQYWPHCYPRVYNWSLASKYASPKVPAYAVCNELLKNTGESGWVEPLDEGEYADPGGLWAMHLAFIEKMRLLWLAPDLATAIRQTQLPDPAVDVDWRTFPLPYESRTIMLPREGSFMLPHDHVADYVSWSRISVGSQEEKTIPHTLIIAAGFDAKHTGAAVWFFDSQLMLTNGRLGTAFGSYGPNNERLLPSESDIDEDDQRDMQLIQRIAQYTLGLALILQDRPHLLSRGQLQKRHEKHGRVREFWTPNVVGANYRLPGPPQDGTHASPRAHRVRGHFRAQACGPNWSERRIEWIEPFWRGLPKEEEA